MPRARLHLNSGADFAETIERYVDLDALIAITIPLRDARRRSVAELQRPRAKIGVARDTAFQFYYAENLDRLRAAGAALCSWSPQADAVLPEVDGLYFGGGYPELHARALSFNAAIREAVQSLPTPASRFTPSAGLMYLPEAIEDLKGVIHPRGGLLPTPYAKNLERLKTATSQKIVAAVRRVCYPNRG
jgi:cobyrinic acid a,c-diamide synthase